VLKNIEASLRKCFEILLKLLTNHNLCGAFARPVPPSFHTTVLWYMKQVLTEIILDWKKTHGYPIFPQC